MSKKNRYIRLCLDPELERESKRVTKWASIFAASITILVMAVVLFILCSMKIG